MEVNFSIIIFSVLIIFFVFYIPSIRIIYIEWKKKCKIIQEAELKRKLELATLKREKQLAELAKKRDIALKEQNEKLEKAKNEEVLKNNLKYKSEFSRKYENARIYHEVEYSGAYKIPISDYCNYDINIPNGLCFFIDNIKLSKEIGVLEVRQDSFEDIDFDSYKLEIIDGFAIYENHLNNKKHPHKRQVYITIRENSFKDINTGLIHNIRYSPYSVSDWK
jgi:hypothetical protein